MFGWVKKGFEVGMAAGGTGKAAGGRVLNWAKNVPDVNQGLNDFTSKVSPTMTKGADFLNKAEPAARQWIADNPKKVSAAKKMATSVFSMGTLQMAGLGYGSYAVASQAHSDLKMHSKVTSMMRSGSKTGSFTRQQDFTYNPTMSFSRPRVRGGHLGATGGLTLALNKSRNGR